VQANQPQMGQKAGCATYVVIGGGGARLLKTLPCGARLADNANAFQDGCRLWAKSFQSVARR
jgi:hypothetical protein